MLEVVEAVVAEHVADIVLEVVEAVVMAHQFAI